MAGTIRRADPADAATLALLGRITFAETFGHLFKAHPDDLRAYLDATFNVTKIERSLGKTENTYWLAFRDRLPIGYAKLKYPSPTPGPASRDAAQLQKIYVLSAFLAQRIGHTLLQSILPEAAGKAPLIWLDVLRENEPAIGFYAKHGFTAIGDDTHIIGAQRFRFHLMARPTT